MSGAFFFPVYGKPVCTYDEDLALSPGGLVTFCYRYPHLFVIDKGSNPPSGAVGKIHIYDCSNPAGLVLISTTDTALMTGPQYPVVRGNYLYLNYARPVTPAAATAAGLTGQLPGFAIWDISDLSTPVKVGELGFDVDTHAGKYNYPISCALIGDVAFVSFGGGFANVAEGAFVDISDPSNPTQINTYKYDATGMFHNCVIAGEAHFYVCGQRSSGGRGMVVSIPLSGTPASGGSLLTTANVSESVPRIVMHPTEPYIYGGILPARDLWTVDISDPSSISEADRMTMTNMDQLAIQGASCVVGETKRAYFGGTTLIGTNKIAIMDISNPAAPALSGSIVTATAAMDMCRITDGCPGFIWSEFSGSEIHLIGAPPLS